MSFLRRWVVLGLLVAVGCGPVSGVNPSPSATNPQRPVEIDTNLPAAEEIKVDPTPQPFASPVPEEGPTGTMEIAYRIQARLDYDQKSAAVDQTITIDNFPPGIASMALVLQANHYSDRFELVSLEADGETLSSYTLEDNLISFALPELNTTSSRLRLRLVYQLQLPVNSIQGDYYQPQAYGYTDRQLNLADWYAVVPPLNGENQWVVHEPWEFGETLVNPAADFQVELTIVDNRVPLVVAASAPSLRSENLYTFKLDDARSFALSISPDYSVLEKTVGGITVRTYAFSDSQAANQAVLQWSTQALPIFQDLFGPLPRRVISVVQADFLDGMEYDGLVFVSKGFYDQYAGTIHGYLSLITVHELAH